MDKYQEALERAKKGLPIDEVFPELKESEDERIRKFLVELVSNDKANNYNGLYEKRGVRFDDVLAYLEKQKEYVSDNFDDIWTTEDCSEIIEAGKKLSPRFKELFKEVCHAWYDKGIELEKQKEQKPAEKITDAEIEQAMDEVTKFKVFAADLAKAFSITHRRDIDWHNFCAGLLTYLELNRPAEWSKEDEKIYQSIMDDTVQENQLNDKQTNWLRDIKYRYFPQPSWKPSEEQMEALARATNRCVGVDDAKILVKLLERLEKL